MTQYYQPSYVTTALIGKILKDKYSLPTDQNTHIDHFFLRVPWEKASAAEKIVPDLKNFLGDDFCALVDKEWPGFIIICCPKQTLSSEVEREKAIDKQLRLPIASLLPDTKVLFSRACLYHSYEMSKTTIKPINVGKIGEAMKQTNAQQEDAHQDYFYLMVRNMHHAHTLNVPSFLRTLPGNWMKVEPHDSWPDTFLGLFPKSYFDKTERERESRLNREVRLPLMKMLEDELMTTYPKTGDAVERKVHILMTRACKLESANTGIKYEF